MADRKAAPQLNDGFNPLPLLLHFPNPPNIKCYTYTVICHNGEYLILCGGGGLILVGEDSGLGLKVWGDLRELGFRVFGVWARSLQDERRFKV